MTNEPLWRALGWVPALNNGRPAWYLAGDMVANPPDYANERGDEQAADAAAVALLEELRQRGHWLAVHAIHAGGSSNIGADPYEVVYMEGTAFDEYTCISVGPIFREAVVAGAAALLGVTAP